MTTARENLGPAETIIQALLAYTDHLVHNRPGIVTPDRTVTIGLRWEPVTHKVEQDQKVVYRLTKVGKKTQRVRVGALRPDKKVVEAGREVAEYRDSGLFPEVATWFYQQVANVWRLDNEFAARWASYAYGQEHRDLKCVLAAFMLVQTRKGDPIVEGGEVLFHDEDFRDVGEAMMLLHKKGDDKGLNPKLLLRIYDILTLPAVAAINHDLGFGQSTRHPFLGRWPRVVEKWLRHREENPKLLEGLIKAGFRTAVMELARRVGYKPTSTRFFEVLRWKQVQADDGRRELAIGQATAAAESWAGLSEEQICQAIVAARYDWKRIVSLLPKTVGVTRAVIAAAMESGGLSNKDLVILTPTLEELGLLDVGSIKDRWSAALKAADDMRASNVARNVRNKETKEKLEEAADGALQKQVEAVTRQLRVYFMVDISGSMESSIATAKEYLAKFIQGFPSDQVHVAVFNTQGKEVAIKHRSAAGVENAFRGYVAGGGTDYGAGVRALRDRKPKADEDVLFIFVGDEEAEPFASSVTLSGLNPMAFGLLKVRPTGAGFRGVQDHNAAVRETARQLKIPCFPIEEAIFADPYAIPRTIRALIAATPITQTTTTVTPRKTLIDQILKTELLTKPTWA